jgi:hypothetical protein
LSLARVDDAVDEDVRSSEGWRVSLGCRKGDGMRTRIAKDFSKLALLILALFEAAACGTQAGVGERPLPVSSALVIAEKPLPEAAFGCWEGTIERFDSVTPLSFAGHFLGESIRTTYQLCYRRIEGGGRLDLTKVEIEGKKATITHFDNHVTAVDGERLTGHLRNHAVLESVVYFMWLFPISAQQDIFADEDIEVKSKDVVAMRGKQLVRVNGTDVAEMTFHTDFHRVADVGGS